MKYINRLLSYLKLKKRSEINFDSLGKSLQYSLIKNKFNASYYGDPYPYDYADSGFSVLGWRKKWIG